MLYENKIEWGDPESCGVVGSTHDPFKSAVLDYQIQHEAEVANIINSHFRDPEAYDVTRAPFSVQIEIARALIGKTPDDGIWDVVESFSKLRNIFAHRPHYGTQEGKKEIADLAARILVKLRKVRPDILPTVNDKEDVIVLVAFTAQRFFRKIRDALSQAKPAG